MKKLLITFLMTVLSAVLLTSCLVDKSEPEKTTDGEGEKPSPAVLSAIEVEGGKREYQIGEEFDYETLVVTLVDETEKILAKDEYEIDFSSFNNSVPGEYLIVVHYKEDAEINAEYTVSVKRDEENESVWGKDLWL